MSNATIVLAGGMSTRLGADKPFLLLHGEPLLRHVISCASRFSDEIVISIGYRDSMTRFEQFLSDHTKIAKDNSEQQSPLIGILTGLRSVGSSNVMILSCDLPFVNEDVVSLLLQRLGKFSAAIPRWSNGNIEPLHSAYRVPDAKLAAEQALSLGHLRVADMIDRISNVTYVDVEDLRKFDRQLLTFFNVNTMEDLENAETMFQKLIDLS